MKEANALNDVAKFHEIFKHPILKNPTIPPKLRCQLRVDLIQEELDELKKAIADESIIDVADALCDIQYVLSGAVLEFGLGAKFADLFAEVQRSNLSKACKSEEEAHETVKYYKQRGVKAYYSQSDARYLIYRDPDNKTLKSVNYRRADLKSILD